jgi:hypothetical protein
MGFSNRLQTFELNPACVLGKAVNAATEAHVGEKSLMVGRVIWNAEFWS